MRVITSGRPFIDIDAYAGIIGYAGLLGLYNQRVIATTSSIPNHSIPPSLRALPAPITYGYQPVADDRYTLIDVSDPEYFDHMVDIQKIDEIIDHHPGLEQYWQRLLGERADIEFVGAASTMVYERWASSRMISNMPRTTAILLAAGILDNTLNFGADITTNRDQRAFLDLQAIAGFSDEWAGKYFAECQMGIVKNLEEAIKNDTKIIQFKDQPSVYGVGQIVIWDAQSIISDHLSVIERTVGSIKSPWFMNVVSIGGGKSYFVCTDPSLQKWLSDLLGVRFTGNIAPSDRLWLRKEIIQASLMR
jgi:inorganic pyrophosphatase/exopolyphosphatase